MGQMIDRRRYMGGKGLPYDAEVEYIHGSTRWDTGILITSNAGFDIETKIYNYAHNTAVFGNTVNEANCNRIVMYNNRIILQRGAYGVTGRNYISFDNDFHHYVLNETVAQIDNAINTSGEAVGVDKNFYLFAGWGDYLGSAVEQSIKHLKIYHGDVLVMDLIPVRKNGHGYFWDNITQRLIGDKNTDWQPGPDKT